MWCRKGGGCLFIEEVEEIRFGADVFLEDEDAFVFEHPADLGIRVEQVAEDAGAGRAGFEAQRACGLRGCGACRRCTSPSRLGADAVAK